VIVAGVLVAWLLIHMLTGVPFGSAATWAGQLGEVLAPAFQLIVIDWEETVALIVEFIAKEIVIGGLAVIYGGVGLTGAKSTHITPLQSMSFMLFCLLYTPCVTTVAAIWSESCSVKLTLLSLIMALQLPGQPVLLYISPVYCLAFTEIENSNDDSLNFEHM
jgi:ferrous iron transport protein B